MEIKKTRRFKENLKEIEMVFKDSIWGKKRRERDRERLTKLFKEMIWEGIYNSQTHCIVVFTNSVIIMLVKA